MSCGKVIGCGLIIGTIAFACYMSKDGGANIRCLKRKGKQLTRKMNEFIDNIDETSLNKYKQDQMNRRISTYIFRRYKSTFRRW